MSTNCWLKTTIIYLLMVLKCGLGLAGWFFPWSCWESLCGCSHPQLPWGWQSQGGFAHMLTLIPTSWAGTFGWLFGSPLHGFSFLRRMIGFFFTCWYPLFKSMGAAALFLGFFWGYSEIEWHHFCPIWQKQVTSQLRFQGWRNKFHIVMEGAAK